MKKILSQSFFERSAVLVARDLLGKYLVRRVGGTETASMITETEAYEGPSDRASHASRGKTERNAPMFGEAARFYVYLCYGTHWMLNITTGSVDYPAAVLLRGAGEWNGPGKLTRNLGIDKHFNNRRAVQENGLWFEDRGIVIQKKSITCLPRVGVAYAGPVWSQKPYRFLIAENARIIFKR
jgi:DNA-3-methyladenine glycosylase